MLHQNFGLPKGEHTQSLLDRPFDSLIWNEWECLKEQSVSYEETALDLVGQIEVDSEPGVSSDIYRLWRGTKLLGTFFQESSGQWVAQPCSHSFYGRLNSPEQAQMLLIAVEILNIQD